MSRARHKAMGGDTKPKTTEYNASGSPEMKEVKSGDDGFKRGGAKHKKGGAVGGMKAKARMDRKPRAGHRASGGTPLSTASKLSDPTSGGPGQGHEGDGPKGDHGDKTSS